MALLFWIAVMGSPVLHFETKPVAECFISLSDDRVELQKFYAIASITSEVAVLRHDYGEISRYNRTKNQVRVAPKNCDLDPKTDPPFL